MFSIFKKKKVVPHVRLTGVIGSAGRFNKGIDLAGQRDILKKAFSFKKITHVAVSINSPGGSPVQSHLIYSYIRQLAEKSKVKVIIFAEDVDYQRKTTGSELENFVFSNNHIYIGLPNVDPADTSDSTIVNLTTADSVGIVTDLRADINIDSWTSLSVQDGMINLDKIKRVLLYSADTDDLLTTLDIVDCRQGRIPRVADVEISYKTFYDPAIYWPIIGFILILFFSFIFRNKIFKK